MKSYINGDTLVTGAFAGDTIFARGGQIKVTLDDPNTFGDSDPVTIHNTNLAAAVMLVGFPARVRKRLYPGQTIIAVPQSSDGTGDPGTFVWSVLSSPGRFPIDDDVSTIYLADAKHGGDDDNDGLSPLRPICTNALATSIIYRDLDCNFRTPIRSLAAGSIFDNDPVIASSQPVGSNLVQLSIHGAGEALIRHLDLPAISIGDNGELDVRIAEGSCLVLQGNMAGHAGVPYGILGHNNPVLDQEGRVRIIGSGIRNRTDNKENQSAYFFDGPTVGAAIKDGFELQGCFGDTFRMDAGGGHFTLSGEITTVDDANGPCFADRLVAVYGTNHLISNFKASWRWASLGASRVSGGAVWQHNGPIVPGGGGPVQTQQGQFTQSRW
jgi:hypothetical protein